MIPKQNALNKKAGTEKILKSFFKGGQRVAGSGRYTITLGHSKSGPCEYCKKMAGTHNIAGGKTPPFHGNCKCTIH